jgi:thiazole synthase
VWTRFLFHESNNGNAIPKNLGHEKGGEMLTIADKQFSSRLFTGTGKFCSHKVMKEAIRSSESELVTVALKRVDVENKQDRMLEYLDLETVNLLPNTSGVRTAKEAVFLAKLAREALKTNWIKLEIHPDPRYLLPDPVETLFAAEELVKEGFVVLPYVNADPVICKRLEEVGTHAVMPLGSPIGSNQGLKTRCQLEIIIEQSNVPVVVDAGIGAPSQAAEAMEIGADAVLVNTAIAVANDPIKMAEAFKLAVQAGRMAYESGMAAPTRKAVASSLTGFLNN